MAKQRQRSICAAATWLVALFALVAMPAAQADVTVTTQTVGNGSVILDPSGGYYTPGAQVQITGDPDSGWQFDHWEIIQAPSKAANPDPSNGATGVGVNKDLSWTAGGNDPATSHDVYFGTSTPPPFIKNQTGTTYDPGTMAGETTHYWRIDEKNAGGTTTGDVWSFTTAKSSCGSAPLSGDGAAKTSLRRVLLPLIPALLALGAWVGLRRRKAAVRLTGFALVGVAALGLCSPVFAWTSTNNPEAITVDRDTLVTAHFTETGAEGEGEGEGECVSEDIVIAGEDPQIGIFDPSLAYDGSNVLWMAHSRVQSGGDDLVDTHISKSTNDGADWTFVLAVNQGWKEQGALAGKWNYEVSSLIYDPTDPDTNARWKLFYYVWRRDWLNQLDASAAWIGYKEAPDPAGPWSDEVIMFATNQLDQGTYGAPQVVVNNLDPGVSGCVAVTEPGGYVKDGVIYLALQNCWGPFPGCDLFYVKSTDHAHTWSYVCKLTTLQDANDIGDKQYAAPDVFKSGTKEYLMVSPVDNAPGYNQYQGLRIFEFVNVTTGELLRDINEHLVTIKFIDGEPGTHRGCGSYDENGTGCQTLLSQRRDTGQTWNIVKTCESIP